MENFTIVLFSAIQIFMKIFFFQVSKNRTQTFGRVNKEWACFALIYCEIDKPCSPDSVLNIITILLFIMES